MEHRQWMKAIVPLSIIVGLQVITGNTSLVVLGFFRADSEVAIYRVALSISSIATFGLITSYTVIQPYIVRLNAVNNQRSLQFIASAGALAALAVTVPVLGIYIFSGKYLLDFLYGSGFVAAYSPLIVLTFGAALHAIFGMGGGLLTMTGNERYVLRASVLTAGLNVLLNLFLTPTYGAMGAATATAIALVAGQMLAYYMAKNLLGIDGSPLYIISAALTSRAEKNSTGNTFD
jgi:O-antigen/teichoic acid export membrane protein